MSDVAEFSKFIDGEKNTLQFFNDEIDALPEVNDWFALYDAKYTENVKFTENNFNEGDYPLLYYSKKHFSVEIGMLGEKFESLYRKWFEKTFNLPVNRLVGW